ncbi:hypothetical protein [Micromonospora wenchangensis]|uniref:hypothetical protein n=1 Tax=Micromonospora wenchangensis TaxID=1185415 RepID=UPI0038201D3A
MTAFIPQTEPLWVGMMHTGSAVSGRVVGWTDSTETAPFPNTDLPTPTGTRGRAVVLVHATSATPPQSFGPVVTIDAGWRARYVATPAEAWKAALELEAEYYETLKAAE